MMFNKNKLFFCNIVLAIMFTMGSFNSYTQDITGIWLTEQGKGKVLVYEQDGSFFGKIIWLKEQTEAVQKVVGTMVLKNVVRQKDNTYTGIVYDPETGNTYKSSIRLKTEKNMKIQGYVGIPLFGRTTDWTKISN